MSGAFSIARLPRIEFGAGALDRLPGIAAAFGKRLLLITGANSFADSERGAALLGQFSRAGFSWETLKVVGEPSPRFVDEAVRQWSGSSFDAVVAIGGGSALDAAKAIAGLLRPGNSVREHLEGVGPEKAYLGPATPLIAVPTTAGTGSEATKNAVLSEHGESGFKKSFRDEKLVPEYAIVDPDLLTTCPPELIAANGMDALTQLLESYVSTRANPMTDALAWSGMQAVRDGLFAWYERTGSAAAGRERMAYAALLSGICLAQTGLGAVHGLASPLGAFFPIAHGVACGTLVATATRINIEAMREREPDNPAVAKYAAVGRLLREPLYPAGDDCLNLARILEDWTQRLDLPGLRVCGLGSTDVPRVVANSRGSSMKTNPIVLTDAEVARILTARL